MFWIFLAIAVLAIFVFADAVNNPSAPRETRKTFGKE